MLKVLRTAGLIALAAITGCVTQRYEYNLAHQHLSPWIEKLPRSEIEEITRVASQHSALPIYCIHYTGKREPYPDEVWVVSANGASMDQSRNGFYRLKKKSGHWELIDGGLGLSNSAIMCDD